MALALDVELALHQLGLGPHRHVLARRHREGAADQAGDAGQTHGPRADGWAPAMPRMSETLDTRPSLIPKTAARAPPPLDVAMVVLSYTPAMRTDPTPVRDHWARREARPQCRSTLAGGGPSRGSPYSREPWLPPCTASNRSRTWSGPTSATASGTSIDQAQVNLFADATGDHQWIHVDPEAGQEGPLRRPPSPTAT